MLLFCAIVLFADVAPATTKEDISSSALSPLLLATISLTAVAELGAPQFSWQSCLEEPFLLQLEEMAGLAKWNRSDQYVGFGEGRRWDVFWG